MTTNDEPSTPQLTTSWNWPSSSILREASHDRQDTCAPRGRERRRDALVQLLDELARAALGRLCGRLPRAPSCARRIAAGLLVVVVVAGRAALHLGRLALAGARPVEVLLLLLLELLVRRRLLLARVVLLRREAVRVLLRVARVLVVLAVRVRLTVVLHVVRRARVRSRRCRRARRARWGGRVLGESRGERVLATRGVGRGGRVARRWRCSARRCS